MMRRMVKPMICQRWPRRIVTTKRKAKRLSRSTKSSLTNLASWKMAWTSQRKINWIKLEVTLVIGIAILWLSSCLCFFSGATAGAIDEDLFEDEDLEELEEDLHNLDV